jgi:hypothetical protein
MSVGRRHRIFRRERDQSFSARACYNNEAASEVVPLDATPATDKAIAMAEEEATLAQPEPVAEPEPVAALTDTPPLPSESTDTAAAEQKVIQVLEEPDGISPQKESETS